MVSRKRRIAPRGSSPLLRSLAAALEVGVIGSTALAFAEWLAALTLAPEFSWDGPLPRGLVLASLGQLLVTHLLVWCPLLGLCALGGHLPVGRERWGHPLAVVSAAFIGVAGFFVVPTVLQLHVGLGERTSIAVRGVVLLLALGSYALLRSLSPPRLRQGQRVTHLAAAACAGLAIVSGIGFVRSPWFDPADYRVPEATARATATPTRPHVLLVVLDTVRADRMSLHGYRRPTTPFLEVWGARSVVFEHAIADGTWTLPSHASMFTGASVRRHGAGRDSSVLDESLPTLAETLSQHGYRTASFSNNALISHQTRLDRGFRVSRVTTRIRWPGARFSLQRLAERLGIRPPLPWLDPDFGAAATNHLIADWLDVHARSGDPIFLFVNYLEAHLPWQVPATYRARFMSEAQLERSYQLRRRAHGDIERVLNRRVLEEGSRILPLDDREVLKRQYDATIRYLDERVGELIGMFQQRGLLEQTLVVIASDHGEYLDSHGMWSHLLGAFNDLTRVTLMVREPTRRKPLRIATPVQLSDIHPTVLKATLGWEAGSSPYGPRDLLALAERGGEPRVVISEAGEIGAGGLLQTHRRRGTPRIARLAWPELTAQDGRFKYVAGSRGRPRLYDLATDPEERHDLIGVLPAAARRLATHLERWREAVPEYEPSEPLPETLRGEALLRALGYVHD